MPEALELSQIGSSQLPPPFRGLHSPGVRKYCQIIFACYFRKSSIAQGKIKQQEACGLVQTTSCVKLQMATAHAYHTAMKRVGTARSRYFSF